MIDSAKLSPCGRYRWRLTRGRKVGRNTPPCVAVVVMVNPSTADAVRNDSTIKKLMGFASKLGWTDVIVVNLFGLRATDVSELSRCKGPVGAHNNDYIQQAFKEADVVVLAWGSSKKFPKGHEARYLEVLALAPRGTKFYCLGETCIDGHPKHPLRLGYETPLIRWRLSYVRDSAQAPVRKHRAKATTRSNEDGRRKRRSFTGHR